MRAVVPRSWLARKEGAKPAGGHRDDLQGLRAVAVLLVVLCHAGVTRLQGGFVGVDVFFVLSGFLITGLLLKQAADGGVSLVEFYSRRARRILPAAALTLVVTDIVAYQLLNFVRAREVMWDSIWASLFAANVHFAQQGTDYFARAQPPSPLQNFWTLAIEEQFYLVWPSLLVTVLVGVGLTRRARAQRRHRHWHVTGSALRRLLLVAGLITVGSLCWSVYMAGSMASYFSPLARAWELGLGAVLAIATTGRTVPAGLRTVLGWVGLAAIAAAGVLFTSDTPFPGSAALLPTLGAAGVIAAGVGGTPRLGAGRLLALPALRYIGDRSYALYLWHWPILIIAVDYEGHELSTPVKLLLVAGAFALSIVTYRLYENPIRRMDWSPSACAFAFSASVAAVVAVAAFSLSSIDATIERRAAAAPSPRLSDEITALAKESAKLDGESANLELAAAGGALPRVVASVQAARRGAPIPSPLYPDVGGLLDAGYKLPGGCAAGDGQSSSSICTLGASSSDRSIAVIGDSHAQMWMPAILAMAEKDRWKVVPFIKSACTPARWIGGLGSSDCRAWYGWATEHAAALHPKVTIVTGAYAGATGREADAVITGVGSIARRLRRASKHVVVVGDPPIQEREPVDCVLARHATMQTCTTSWGLDQQSTVRAVSDLADRDGAGFMDTTGWFCFQSECPLVIAHRIAFFDRAHITQVYALQLAGPFREAFRRGVAEDGAGA